MTRDAFPESDAHDDEQKVDDQGGQKTLGHPFGTLSALSAPIATSLSSTERLLKRTTSPQTSRPITRAV